jgi:hypothetical protein
VVAALGSSSSRAASAGRRYTSIPAATSATSSRSRNGSRTVAVSGQLQVEAPHLGKVAANRVYELTGPISVANDVLSTR